MPEETNVTNPVPDPNLEPEKSMDPWAFLATFKGAPSKATVDVWKRATCNGRVKLMSPHPDGKRVFLLRGLSAREWEAAQTDIPAGIPPEKYELELSRAVSTRATLWSNVGNGQNGQLMRDDLMNSGAGLTSALYEAVMELSDFMSPRLMEALSVDL